MISGDPHSLSEKSDVYKRLTLQAQRVERLDVLVRGGLNEELHLRGRGSVRRYEGSKVRAAFSMMRFSGKYDVVTTQDPFFLGFIGWVIAKRIGARLQVQVHTDVFSAAYRSHSFGNRIRSRVAHFILKRAYCVRVVSERVRLSLKSYGISSMVLPVFVDTSRFAAAERTELPGTSTHKIMVVSRLEKEKNLEEAISLMRQVRASYPDAVMYIVGDGSERGNLERCVAEAGLDDAVVFLGYRSVIGLYKDASVLFVPSTYEGFGAVIIEALASGLPVVSADVGIAREAGAIVVPREEFASAIIQTLKQPIRGALAARFSQSAEEWSEAWRLSLEKCLGSR